MTKPKKIHLDSRLSAALDYVTINGIAADIGTDHAYLPCRLIQDNISSHCLACDINPEPLKSAENTVKSCNLTDKITLKLCDGLSAFTEADKAAVTDIIIAGMGGELIAHILSSASWVFNSKYNLILQPMTKVEYLRGFLCENGFEIKDETACIAANKHYTVLNAAFCGNSFSPNDLFLQTGKLLDKNDEAAVQYKKMTAQKLIKAAKGILSSGKNLDSAQNMLKTAELISKSIS